jgi:hypothetical protein
MAELETRTFKVRARPGGSDAPGEISGYAAVFNQLSDDLGGWREIVAPGAFTASLQAGRDVRALFNHDPNYVLGRTKSGTLSLAEDDLGLAFRAILPGARWAQDLAESMARGDIDQCSFAFYATRDEWATLDGAPVRKLIEVELVDVSVVTVPAYPQTIAQVRAALERAQNDSEAASQAAAASAAVEREMKRRRLELAAAE